RFPPRKKTHWHITFYIHPKDVIQGVHGHAWWHYRNISNCLKMLENVIKYSKQFGAEFLTAHELANLYLEKIFEN
ncbi:MAG: hypothetical protein QXF61_09380, partial [Nitrososphaeria archaeon]